MISEKELQFIQYWEKHRVELGKPISKLLRGLPVATLFVLPILLSMILVNILSPDWYTKVAPKDSGAFTTIFIALFICVLFISYFRMQFKWESNEQAYNELKQKQGK